MTAKITVYDYVFEYSETERGYVCDEIGGLVDKTTIKRHKRPWRAFVAGRPIANKSGNRPKSFASAVDAARAIIRRIDRHATIKNSHRALTYEQIILLRNIRDAKDGRYWRSRIRNHWYGNSPFRQVDLTDGEREILADLRKTHGVKWLARYVLE